MTLRHVVCFRFVEGTAAEEVVAMTEALRALPAIIPEIADYRVGPDLAINADSWDFVVNADFADAAAYVTYRDHPQHQEIIARLVRPITAERASAQFRI